jgi:hypothetical protein
MMRQEVMTNHAIYKIPAVNIKASVAYTLISIRGQWTQLKPLLSYTLSIVRAAIDLGPNMRQCNTIERGQPQFKVVLCVTICIKRSFDTNYHQTKIYNSQIPM